MKNSTFTLTAAVCLLFVVFLAGCGGSGNGNASINTALTSPTPDPCAGKSDSEIVTTIYGKIVLAGMGGEVKQINVVSTNRAVSLWGWVKDATEKQKVIDIAKNSCAASVNSDNFYDTPDNPLHPIGGCRPPNKPCGDLCVASNVDCSLPPSIAPGANSNGHSNSNSNKYTPANSNTNTKR